MCQRRAKTGLSGPHKPVWDYYNIYKKRPFRLKKNLSVHTETSKGEHREVNVFCSNSPSPV